MPPNPACGGPESALPQEVAGHSSQALSYTVPSHLVLLFILTTKAGRPLVTKEESVAQRGGQLVGVGSRARAWEPVIISCR